MQIKHAIFLYRYFRWILTSEADLKIWPHPGFVEQNALYVETGQIVINLTSNVQNAISTTVMLLPSLFIPVLVVPFSLPSSLQHSSPELAPDSGLQQWFLLPKSMPILSLGVQHGEIQWVRVAAWFSYNLYTKPKTLFCRFSFLVSWA